MFYLICRPLTIESWGFLSSGGVAERECFQSPAALPNKSVFYPPAARPTGSVFCPLAAPPTKIFFLSSDDRCVISVASEGTPQDRSGAMKTLAWNCRRMLSSTAVRELLDFQGQLRADVVFLFESHLNKAKVIELKSKLGFDLLNIVESDGRSCGLVMFYNLINDVVLNFSSQNFIDGLVMNYSSVAWRFTRFYGEPSWELKH